MMFEAGKSYRIRLIESDAETSFHCRVIEVDGVLIKIANGYDGKEQILNCASLYFIGAEQVEDRETDGRPWDFE